MPKKRYTAIDLFCGAGGLTLGLSNAGFKVLAGVENNRIASETYKANHPAIKLYEGDIRHLSAEEVLSDLQLKPGELDLLAGCPPCQGFSSQRTRNKSASIDDARNELVFEFLRFVEITLPKTIMLENVPSLSKDWRVAMLKESFSALGYRIDDQFAQIKDAADFGVPQRRRRLILKASRLGVIANAEIIKSRSSVRDAIFHMKKPGKSGDALHDFKVNRSEKVKKLITHIPKNGGSRIDLPRALWLNCHKKNEGGYRDVYGRMRWDDVSPTITGGCHNPSKGRFLHPDQDRAITLREAAILQTFPEDYKFSLDRGKDSVALMIGNALPPLFIEQHAKKYIDHLNEILK